MKIYVVCQKFLKDVQRKNSKTLSARKGELRLHKAYTTRSNAEKEINALAKSNDYIYIIEEKEANIDSIIDEDF